ncbi:MAG: DUF4011 domain-containing protein [Bacteroidia bacterium]|nr:DUF4011 domain-containing protein [Bacteroidia bacterium]
MKEILHTYKLRLTNISQGNRAIKLLKLSPRRDLDFTSLAFLEEESAEMLFQKVLAGKNVRLIQKLDARFEKTNLVDKQLNHIYRELQAIFEETGTKDLYVGYPFVEGKFADGTPVRCPVLLFPVELIRNLQGKPRWALEVPKDTEIILNTSFFLAYELHQNLRIPAAFWDEIPEYSEDWTAFLQNFYQFLKKYEIEVNFNPVLFEKKIAPFIPYNKEKMDAMPVGVLTFQPNLTLGIFPQSDSSLLQDYETLEANTADFDLQRFFTPVNQVMAQSNTLHTVPEELRFFVTPLDKSQEEVLLKIKSGKSLVVHGPPGTGKSQVIVNMIADALTHGKKVLVVSQKRAALDVVFKRISALGLGDFAALVHDQQSDRVPIFQKIKKQIDDIPLFQKEIQAFESIPTQNGFDVWAKHADNMRLFFDDLFEALTQKQTFGLNIHTLYLECNREDIRFNLSEVARDLSVLSLRQLNEKLLHLLDYAEFFQKEYPWINRIPFSKYGYQDKFTLAEKIGKIKPVQEALKAQYENLKKLLGDNLLNIEQNREYIRTFRNAEGIIQDEKLLSAVQAIYKDGLKPDFIAVSLRDISTHFQNLSNSRLLKGEKWDTALSLSEKFKLYLSKKNEAFRIFSGEYHKANSFIQSLLSTKGFEWNEAAIPFVSGEVQNFEHFLNTYTQLIRFSFFSDFKTENILNGWEQWLEQKHFQFDAWRFLEGIKHLQYHKPEFNQGELNTGKWENSIKIIQLLESFTDLLEEAGQQWSAFLHPEQISLLFQEIQSEKCDYADALNQSLPEDFEDLRQLDVLLDGFTPAEYAVLSVIRPVIEQNALSLKQESAQKDLVNAVQNSIYFEWIQQTEIKYPVLTEVSTRGFVRKQEDYSAILANKRNSLLTYIFYILKKRIAGNAEYDKNNQPVNFREILHQVSKKRKLWTVRKLIHTYWHQGLHHLIPCWMASPESVSAIFPMEENYFDLVIFDEASQCFVERAIPVMLRGRQTVIAGDAKQLQPFDMYSVRYEEGEAVENEMALEVESILDLAKTHWEEAKLNWHYRSKEEELINFSNQAFYEGKLQVIPAATPEAAFLPPLEWAAVNGEWKNNRNEVEANRVLEIVLHWINTPEPPSMGIVTFNYFQQELIKDLLDKKLEELATSDPVMYEKLQAAIHKTENEEYMGLFVKNIENVQGDERDVMIFSVGYAKNEQGKLTTQFGLLNLSGGENRLNVAITRARKKIYVVCSFNPSDLNVEGSKYEGPKLLKSYLQYVKAVSEDRPEEANQILQSQSNQALPASQEIMTEHFARKLTEAGFFVIRNFGDTQYRVDLAVKRNPEDRSFILALECEGENYFSGETAKEREVYRRQLLLQHGWKVHRVWARNFWMNKEKEWEKIMEKLQEGGE